MSTALALDDYLEALLTAEPEPPPPSMPAVAPPAPPPQAVAAPIAPPAPVLAQPAPMPFAYPRPDEAGAPVPARHEVQASRRWLRLRCDQQQYALELLKVQEVVLPTTLLPLRGAPRHMLGVMNLRGQVVPVIDLGLFLGREAIQSDGLTRIVVLEEDGETLGLRVSAVEDVANIAEHGIEPPDHARVCRITNHLFRGIARLGGMAIVLLDASRLLK